MPRVYWHVWKHIFRDRLWKWGWYGLSEGGGFECELCMPLTSEVSCVGVCPFDGITHVNGGVCIQGYSFQQPR